MDINLIAKQLDDAASNAASINQISVQHNFDINAAYAIQKTLVNHRVERGNPIVGLKMGFTSEAKMKQMGVSDMIWGRLTSDMLIASNDTLELSKFIHPRSEPEIAFRIAKDITEEVQLTDLLNYVDGVAAAIEVIDSRFLDFKFNLNDVIADNCSSAAFVLGPWSDPNRELTNLKMELYFDGVEVEAGNSNDILGNPWKSLQAATRLAAKYGEPIKAGYVILAGAATPAVFMKSGSEVGVAVAELGKVSFKTV